MLKLYKRVGDELHYWVTWDQDNRTAIVHWGVTGHKGEMRKVKSGLYSDFKKAIRKEIDQKIVEGYAEIEEGEMAFLEIEFPAEGLAEERRKERLAAIQDKLNEVLGWTGIGQCDQSMIDGDLLVFGCMVVQYELARKTITRNFRGNEFSDYSKIIEIR